MTGGAILFDFDYTLADSSDAIIECFHVGLAALGLQPAAPDAIRATIGLSLEESLAAVAGESFRPRALEFRRAWRGHSDKVMVEMTRLLPGAAETIRRLADGDHRLGVVSTKYRTRIEEVLARAELSHCFQTVIGGDDVSLHKPDPEGLKLAMERLRLEPSEALYVGDSLADAEAAHRAGVPFIGVLTGVTSAQRLAKWPCMDILPSISALPEYMAARREKAATL